MPFTDAKDTELIADVCLMCGFRKSGARKDPMVRRTHHILASPAQIARYSQKTPTDRRYTLVSRAFALIYHRGR